MTADEMHKQADQADPWYRDGLMSTEIRLKPPLGIQPYGSWVEHRVIELARAIRDRVIEVGIDDQVGIWANELNQHAEKRLSHDP